MNSSTLVKASFLPVLFAVLSCGRTYTETQPFREDITVTVFASGTLEARNSYTLTARADGYITHLLAEVNDRVQPNQVLALIDNRQNQVNAQRAETLYLFARSNTQPDAPELKSAQNATELAEKQMKQDSITARKYVILNDDEAVPVIEYEQKQLQYERSLKEYKNALQEYEAIKKQAEEQLVINRSQKEINQALSSYNQVRAVTGGKVYKKFKEAGDFVRKGEPIVHIGDAHQFYAQVNIDEKSIEQLEVGQEAIITLNVNTERTYRAVVVEIFPSFDESLQSFTARLAFTDSLHFKMIHTQLEANIVVDTVNDALLIPRTYVGYGNEVMLKGSKKPRPIETRLVGTQWVHVTSGLTEEDIIITQQQ